MADDAGKLLELMLITDVLKRYSDICKMLPGQLVKRLEFEGVSIGGDMSELRGRLLRLEVKQVYPKIEVPWYLEDEIPVKKRPDGLKASAKVRWELREASKTSGKSSQLTGDVILSKSAKDKQEMLTDVINAENSAEDEVAVSQVSERKKRPSNFNIILSWISKFLAVCDWIRNINFSPAKQMACLAFNVLKLTFCTWFLDSYIFYNKGFHIYVVVYWLIMALYSLREDKHRIYVYIRNYPFEHRMKLLIHSLLRIMVVTFSFTFINSFIWYDNVMFVCLILFNFTLELCILIKEINDYEQNKCTPNYFLYSIYE